MQQDNLILLEGRNICLESISQGRNIKIIYIENTAKGDKVQQIVQKAKDKGITVKNVKSSFLKKISKTDNHQGIIALAEKFESLTSAQFLKQVYDQDLKNVGVCILRKLDFEHNLGAIIRTASAAGISAVVVPKGKKSSITETVERVSMGGMFDVKIIEESFYSALSNFKKAGFAVFAFEVTGDKYYFEQDLTGDVCFIFGSESETLGEEVTKNTDQVLKLPIQSQISSLNVSVSAGIIFYERLKQIINKN